MPRQIYVTLPIRDMERSKAFFGALGFSFNPQFTNEPWPTRPRRPRC